MFPGETLPQVKFPLDKNDHPELDNSSQQRPHHQVHVNRKISMIFPLVSCCSCVNNSSVKSDSTALALEAITCFYFQMEFYMRLK